ncbi:ABC transporter permease [Streptococcaceae bacterium ESL0687]|nr:ABC transporter permease [Streptococcaceae bacterium ESL0687]
MANKFGTLFLKKDICKLSIPIFWMLSLISGFSIIYSREYLGGPFRVDNIYAMFSTFSIFLIIYLSVSLFGTEFQYKTINMIRISNRSPLEIILRKLTVMLIVSLVTSLIAYSEVLIQQLYYGHNEINLVNLLSRITSSYLFFGLFLFSIGTIVVLYLKNTLFSFIFVLLFLRLGAMIVNILGNFSELRSFIEYVPFTFAENAFSFASYTGKQALIMIIWSLILLAFTPILYKQRGYE